MFSVVIPLYNKAKYIEKAVRSVLGQTISDFELIIVNDGSTDDSLAKLKSIEDDRVLVIHQQNAGVSTARNNGVKAAKYDYIAFLDADDWWDAHFLEEMKHLIEDYPNAALYGSQYYWVKNGINKKSINHKPAGYRGYINYFETYTSAWWMPCTSISVAMKKNIFIKLGGFNPFLKFGEDFDFWIRIALQYPIAYLNKPLAFYNQDVESSGRALGNAKNYDVNTHFIFNLSSFNDAELKNVELKKLLDGLRVRSLLPYYLSGLHTNEVESQLLKVDFRSQPLYYRFIYGYPLPIVRLFWELKRLGSVVKQTLIGLKVRK